MAGAYDTYDVHGCGAHGDAADPWSPIPAAPESRPCTRGDEHGYVVPMQAGGKLMIGTSSEENLVAVLFPRTSAM